MKVIDELVGRHFKKLEYLLLQRMKNDKVNVDTRGMIMATISKSFDFMLDDLYIAKNILFKEQKQKDNHSQD